MYGIDGLLALTKLLLVLLAGLLYSSLVEYCLHRFLLHSSYEQEHIKVHHKVFHGVNSYELEEINNDTVLSSLGEIARNIALYLPLAILVFFQNRAFGVVFLATCIVYNLWEEFVHFHFHKKNNLYIENVKFYKKLKEHHRIHHYAYQYNYGIGTSFWDVIFRTKKR